MRRRFTFAALVLAPWILLQSPALAMNEHPFELTGTFGYTFNEGVNVNDRAIEEGGDVFREITPQSSISFGAGADYRLPYKAVMLGFHWTQISTEINGKIVAGPERKLADFTQNNFHGTITWEFPSPYRSALPFLRIGFGATRYSVGSIEGMESRGNDSDSRFSTTWALGIKGYTQGAIGFALQGQWIPTYIKSDTSGYWCDYYGCWTTSNADYQNQLELGGALIVRM